MAQLELSYAEIGLLLSLVASGMGDDAGVADDGKKIRKRSPMEHVRLGQLKRALSVYGWAEWYEQLDVVTTQWKQARQMGDVEQAKRSFQDRVELNDIGRHGEFKDGKELTPARQVYEVSDSLRDWACECFLAVEDIGGGWGDSNEILQIAEQLGVDCV